MRSTFAPAIRRPALSPSAPHSPQVGSARASPLSKSFSHSRQVYVYISASLVSGPALRLNSPRLAPGSCRVKIQAPFIFPPLNSFLTNSGFSERVRTCPRSAVSTKAGVSLVGLAGWPGAISTRFFTSNTSMLPPSASFSFGPVSSSS